MSLTKAKKQEIFDTICEKLAKQKKRSLSNDGSCAYNGTKGTHCAIGHLIKVPRRYNGHSIYNLPEKYLKMLDLKDCNDRAINFYIGLQYAHDHCKTLENLKEKLKEIAYIYKLKNGAVKLITEWEGTTKANAKS